MARPPAFQPVPTSDPEEGNGPTEADSEPLPVQAQGQESFPPMVPASLTRLNGLALVMSLQIGSGIFTAPSQVSSNVPSPGVGLVAWLLGGLLVWTGAVSFIELGLRVPANGGMQEYLGACFGEAAAFLFTWVWVCVAKPAANAAIATIFADYLLGPLVAPTSSTLVKKAASLACVAAVTFVNCLGATAGARAANMFLVLKITALASIITLGAMTWVLGYGDGVPAGPEAWFGIPPGREEQSRWAEMGAFSTALFGALFCYGGWESIGFVVGDMANAEHDLPLVINGAMTVVIAGFLLMNAALYVQLPMDVIRQSNTVAVDFARHSMGSWGGLVFSVVVSISAMGALNSNTFSTAKLCVSASQRRYFPAALANLHCPSAQHEAEYLDRRLRRLPASLRRVPVTLAEATRRLRWHRGVPVIALVGNGLLCSFYVLMGSFRGLVTFIGLAEYSCFLASVLGLLVLRRRPGQTRPKYTTRTYNPVIFSMVSGLLILRGVMAEPLQGLALAAIALSGVAVYYAKCSMQGPPLPLAAR